MAALATVGCVVTTTLRGFMVDLWQPRYNHLDGNHGSIKVIEVVAFCRQEAILTATRRYYWPNKLFIPPEQIVTLDERARQFYIAFRPHGAAVGKVFLVQARTKQQVWDELPAKIGGKRPAWVEKISTHRAPLN